MKPLSRAFKLAAILILSLFAVLFTVSFIVQDKVAGIILKSLNNNFQTKINTGSYRLSLIKKFPKATVELKNVTVFSSPDFDRSGFKGINTDTLLVAKSAFIDFRIMDLIKGDYTFTSITIKSGNLNLFTDKSGHYNYDVSPQKDDNTNGKAASLNLNKVNLADMRVLYNDLRADLIIKSLFRNSRIKSRITGINIDFESNTEMIIRQFSLGSFAINYDIPADVQASLTKNEKGVFFRKSTLGINSWDFILTGFIASDNYLDLTVTGKDLDISGIAVLLPDKYKKIASEYKPSGILKFESTIKGIASRDLNPHYEITWSLKDANIGLSGSRLKVDKFSFESYYSNGRQNRPETSTFTIANFKTRLGSADYKGSFSATDFTRPKIKLAFSGSLYPSELKEFLDLRNVESTGGSVSLNLQFEGYPGKKESYYFSDIIGLDSKSEAVFTSFGIKLKNKPVDIKDAAGKIVINGKITSTESFRFNFNDQRITLSSSLANLPEWLAGGRVNLTGSARISASCLKPDFMKPSREASKASAPERAPVTFPGDVILNADIDIDTLIYKKFIANNVRGSLSYKPRILNFNDLSLNSQKGVISGSGFIAQNSDKSFLGKGKFTLAAIDVNETFTTFNNFGQGFLKAENLRGSLSGSLSLLIPADSLLEPDIKSVTAEGKYILTDGALVDFDPVKELSSFIELSELETIKFDQLENDFFIRANALYIPQMDVRSSAADLSVNGKHSFNNDYEYHVKVLLSEILSRKARKKRPLPTSEFGEVEDDGLGRTSLLLKVAGRGDDLKVSYDVQAAGKQVRDELRKERENLRNIINEEYGRYKSDPQAGNKTSSKPRFRVIWEGSDTVKRVSEDPDVKKETLFKKLFKKN